MRKRCQIFNRSFHQTNCCFCLASAGGMQRARLKKISPQKLCKLFMMKLLTVMMTRYANTMYFLWIQSATCDTGWLWLNFPFKDIQIISIMSSNSIEEFEKNTEILSKWIEDYRRASKPEWSFSEGYLLEGVQVVRKACTLIPLSIQSRIAFLLLRYLKDFRFK